MLLLIKTIEEDVDPERDWRIPTGYALANALECQYIYEESSYVKVLPAGTHFRYMRVNTENGMHWFEASLDAGLTWGEYFTDSVYNVVPFFLYSNTYYTRKCDRR